MTSLDLSVEDARARMLAAACKLPAERIGLDAALGQVLAEPVIASRDQPPCDISAMDGWAVAGRGSLFDIVGESAAGRGFGKLLHHGQAVRIFTGAPVPPGAERVVIQEDAKQTGAQVRMLTPPSGSINIRLRGGDFHHGERLLVAGVTLDPWRIGLAAAAGCATLSVAHRPRVTVISTGDEIVAVGRAAGPDQIFNSGGPSVSALVTRWGSVPFLLPPVADEIGDIAAAVASSGGDVLVTLGGASVGKHDLVKPALRRLGLEIEVESIRIRPGRPTWFGRLSDGRRVLGLPGNPAAALVCAELFLRPLLQVMQGATPGPKLIGARLAKPMPANGPRELWARARLDYRGGELWTQPVADQDSSLVSVFAESDALIRRLADAPVAEFGTPVDVLMLDRL